jgi:hypothetical protein
MKIKYGIIICAKSDVLVNEELTILHFAGFEKRPDISDYVDMIREFSKDGMDVVALPAPSEIVKELGKQ